MRPSPAYPPAPSSVRGRMSTTSPGSEDDNTHGAGDEVRGERRRGRVRDRVETLVGTSMRQAWMYIGRVSPSESPTHVAVLCDAFLRYGSGQARGIAAAG